MNRRKFCRDSLLLAAITALPILPGCKRQAKTSAQADTALRGITLDGREIDIEAAAVKEFGDSMMGPVILSGHPEYDSARMIWNGMHDKRPALIARCLNSADVSHAVTFARERNLLLAVRGGGHSWPGNSVCDAGMMIDLSQMRQVAVDPQAQRARTQGGALLSDLDTAALERGLVTTAGVVSHTGVAGFTLGGGFGNLNRKYGLAVDNLVSAEIVTADGKIRRISAEQEPDLFWAIRGGGGNFGVVTEFEYQLHPFDRQVLAGNIVWPLSAAKNVLDFYAEWSTRLSDAMYAGPILMTLPDGSASLVMNVLYNGKPAAGEKEIMRLRKVGKPVQDGIKVQDYLGTQTQSDGFFHQGIRSYAKNGMVKQWSKDLINAMVEANDPRILLGSHVAGGAVKRIGELDTAFPHRNAEVMLVVVAAWQDPNQDDERIAAARAYFKAIEPYTGGYYDNIDFDRSAATSNYGPAYERLARIKGQVDPGNQFRLNSNIQPAV